MAFVPQAIFFHLQLNSKKLCYTVKKRGDAGMGRVLIVEDDPDILEMLSSWLSEAEYQIVEAQDGLEAIDKFADGKYDLVLLDLMLPKIDGFGVCEWIRKRSDVPIVMLTALDGEAEQLRGYDLKIDDYVTKPFSMPVLLRKIGAILRRCEGERPEKKILRYRDLTLDLDAFTAHQNARDLVLTAREFELLRELVQNQGRVITYQMLINRLWNYDYLGDDRVVYSHIKNLRRKLDADYIQTVRGVGYRIEKP
jgi:two-component system response regulator VanR